MPQPYLGHIVLYALVAVAIPGGIVLLALTLTKRLRTGARSARASSDTYESGMVPSGGGDGRYRAPSYLYGLIFVIFDVEVVFLYPWAVVFRQVGLYGLYEIAIFIGILLVGLAYAWRRGALRST